MRTHIVLPALCLALIAWDDSSLAQTVPQAGQWELTTDMQGMPFGGGTKTSKACIKAEQLTAGPEQAIIEAGMASYQSSNSSGNTAPKCSFTELKRESNASSWKANCEGPRGSMQGAGYGTLAADTAQLQQSFEANTPMGKRTLKQTITAKRLGECQ
jgi:hypothetical protein